MQSKSAYTRRRWFQIHLSTTMIVAICAAFLLWANIRVNSTVLVEDGLVVSCMGHMETKTWWGNYVAGWPLEYVYKRTMLSNVTYKGGVRVSEYSRSIENPPLPVLNFGEVIHREEEKSDDEFYSDRLGINAGVALFVLLLSTVILEWSTRRFHRSTGREPQPAPTISSFYA